MMIFDDMGEGGVDGKMTHKDDRVTLYLGGGALRLGKPRAPY